MASTADRADSQAIALVRADLNSREHRDIIVALTRDYFEWMNLQVLQAMGRSIPDLIGMELDPYISCVLESICRCSPPESVFYLAQIHGRAAGMGGLRRLPDGSAEIVRIYTRPEHRGLGIGTLMVQRLIAEARRFGYSELKLDTGTFMQAAQTIYRAAGFVEIEPYEGAEPPPSMHSIWLFMRKTL